MLNRAPLLKWVLRELWREKVLFLVSLFVGFLFMAASLLEPHWMGKWVEEQGYWGKVWAGTFVLKIIFQVLSQGILFPRLAFVTVRRIRDSAFLHFLKLPLHTQQEFSQGKVVTRVLFDSQAMSEMFSWGFLPLAFSALFIVFSIGALLFLNIELALIALGPIVVLFCIMVPLNQRIFRKMKRSRKGIGTMNAYLTETLNGYWVWKFARVMSKRIDDNLKLHQDYLKNQLEIVHGYSLLMPSVTVFVGLSVSLVMMMGVRRVLAGDLSVGTLVSAVLYLIALYQPFRELIDRWTVLLSGWAAGERIMNLMNLPQEMDAPISTFIQKPTSHSLTLERKPLIEFDRVSFSFIQPTLREVSFSVFSGEHLGVLGRTGAGKSTIVQLLLRLREPKEGKIIWNGIPSQNFSLSEWRRRFGVVQQQTTLFKGTLQDNITLFGTYSGIPQKHLKNWLEQLKWNYPADHEIDSQGRNLSSGERQIISFLRALSVNPQVWIFDEATAHLDQGTEAVVEKIYHEWSQQQDQPSTRITIAHRTAILGHCDRKIWLENGRLVDSWVRI